MMDMKVEVVSKCIILTLALVCSLAVFPVKAQGTTIIVPDNYPNISSAINAAENGDTIFVRSGSYEGPINETLAINKTISLVGENKETTKIHLNPPLIPMNIFTYSYMGYTDAISITADNVKITGLTIETLGGNIVINASKTAIFGNNLGIGVTINGDQTQIVDNTLNGFGLFIVGNNTVVAKNTAVGRIEANGDYNLIAYNSVNGSAGESIVTHWGNNSVVLSNTIVSANNWSLALQIRSNSRENLIAKNNLYGGGLEVSPYTFFNTICGNNLNGWGVGLMGFNNLFYANQLNYVGIGGGHGGTVDAAYNTFYRNNFLDISPEFQVHTKQPGPITWDNGVEGNFWSNYTGDGTASYEVFAEYHYFDGAVREDTNVSLGQDSHPLLTPFDIQSLQISLPAWAEASLQNLPQTSPLPPIPTPSLPSQTATATTPSQLPSQSPPSQQIPHQPPFPATTVYVAATLALVITAGLLFYIKQWNKRRRGSLRC